MLPTLEAIATSACQLIAAQPGVLGAAIVRLAGDFIVALGYCDMSVSHASQAVGASPARRARSSESIGVPLAQGFLFARPAPVSEYLRWS